MRIRSRILLLACTLLSACASTSQNGRAQLSMPTSVSAVYSEVDMRVQLAAAAAMESECSGAHCAPDPAFDKQVQRLGASLGKAAFAAYPALRERFERFDIRVADNNDPGSLSSAAGTVVIYRGLQPLHLDDPTLAFVIAREIGHVIDGHHDENAASGIMVSMLAEVAQLLLPVPFVLRGIASAMPAEAFVVATTTTTTAASLVGARAVRSGTRSDQLREADDIALELLARQGWYGREVAAALNASIAALGKDDWSADLRDSALRVAELTQGPPEPTQADIAPAPVANDPPKAPEPLLVRGPPSTDRDAFDLIP